MFDIGFWELLLIAVVALLVIGPERLPGVARKTGLWVGKMRRFVASVKADVDREIAADELKKTMARQMESTGLYDIIEETRDTVNAVKQAAAEIDKPAATTPEAEALPPKTDDSAR